ncbi:MAG TPA: TerB family tellurite resistance protein [Bacteroidia bacterium]|nr:TerB family tellurite resistance protein [Bacteroidia bacterium]
MKFAKWIGGGLGWAFGGPIGALIGYALGSMLDSAEVTVMQPGSGPRGTMGYDRTTARGDFAMSLLVLTAAVMKSDGRILKSELDYVKRFLTNQFSVAETERLMPVLKELIGKQIPLAEVCLQIRQYMPEAQRIQLLHYLFGISKADGLVHDEEIRVIGTIAGYLGIAEDFQSVKAMYWRDAAADYTILEIPATSTDEEVKKAYRKMAVKYHPDKVADLGETAQKNAKEQFQKVQEAYDSIKKKREMS